MTIATAVIPISPKHKATGVYQQALESVRRQTIPTATILQFDDNGDGAAVTRNKGTAQVTTPFVIWIDADDILRPTFVEDCVKVYQRGTYVYTDWVIHGAVINTPDCLRMWDEGQEHVITTLLPTIAWQSVGGFDETLDTLEDEDFYRKLHAHGWCGVRCPEPLIEYRRHLGASLVNKDNIDSDLQKQRVAEKHALFQNRYRRFQSMVQRKCCGNGQPKLQKPKNEKHPNDVLVETLYDPQRLEGAVTRRFYPRAGLGKPMWVDEDDARARPDLFKIIGESPENISPDVETVQKLANEAVLREARQTAEEELNETLDNIADALSDNQLDNKTVQELTDLADKKGIEVIGTGARGRVLKDDLIRALS